MVSRQKAQFFQRLNDQGLAVTYDDVRLRTIVSATNRVSAAETDTASRFSRNVKLKVPLVSSPMDTVTGSDMAIAMAMMGGLGIIHAAYDIEEQRSEARRVKLYRNGLIEKPVVIHPSDTVQAVLNMRAEKKYDFSTFPVVDDNRLVGMFTQTDIDFCQDYSERVHQHMTPFTQVVSAKENTTLEQAWGIMKKNGKLNTLPLVKRGGRLTGLYIKSDVLRLINDDSGGYNTDGNGRLLVGAAVPTDPVEAEERLKALEKYIDVIVIDTANGNSKYLYETLKHLKSLTSMDIVAGNVSEPKSVTQLAEAGADGIRVGQGGGSICSTRQETGIGTPQVTAVYECSRVAELFGIPVCADGGIKDRGDISIGLAAGAESVMMGNMLAAMKETPGATIMLDNGNMVKEYRGMGSPGALRSSQASRKRYGGDAGPPLPEGVETQLPYKGSVFDVLPTYVKALRKSMEYVGAPDISSLRQSAMFWRITNAGLRESRPHDL